MIQSRDFIDEAVADSSICGCGIDIDPTLQQTPHQGHNSPETATDQHSS